MRRPGLLTIYAGSTLALGCGDQQLSLPMDLPTLFSVGDCPECAPLTDNEWSIMESVMQTLELSAMPNRPAYCANVINFIQYSLSAMYWVPRAASGGQESI